MNLVVDIGNTQAKIAVIQENEVVEQWCCEGVNRQIVEHIVGDYAVKRAIVASTRADEQIVAEIVKEFVADVVVMQSTTAVPIDIEYATRETLGVDRIAAAVGAVAMYGKRRMLIVDFGTAITIDLVEGGCFRGGNISLGAGSRFRALNEYTARLPLLSMADATYSADGSLGGSTREAIVRGVVDGICYEIEGYIASITEKKGDLTPIFCGGDAKCFVNRIKNAIFADYKMTFIGLNKILEHNASDKHI